MNKESCKTQKCSELHKELWLWVSETGQHKRGWPRWVSNGGDVLDPPSHCFACGMGGYNAGGPCVCPLDWGIVNTDGCRTPGSLYDQWSDAFFKCGTVNSENIVARNIAEEIANIPWTGIDKDLPLQNTI